MIEVPKRRDIIWINFSPQKGHEQSGRRPAIVISPTNYNRKVGLVLVCPITSQAKGYAFEVPLPKELKIQGVILADQVKSFDWRERKSEFCERVDKQLLKQVMRKLTLLFPQ